MKIALTGSSGRLGRAIQAEALRQGHHVTGIDQTLPADPDPQQNLQFIQADIGDFDQLKSAMAGCDALIHMAAIPSPGNHPDHVVHNNNVTGSYNALLAAAEQGIGRICLASSVNAIGLAFGRKSHFDYFPIDEDHPTYCDEPYSLSKWICEQQAAAFARRYDEMRIACMRFHLTVAERSDGAKQFTAENESGSRQLWAYTRFDAAARACLLSLEADFTGHEVFYIVAPDTTIDVPSRAQAERFFPDVPIRGNLEGRTSFFDSSKAERLLGWKHDLQPAEMAQPKT